jgi:hypothetical protein
MPAEARQFEGLAKALALGAVLALHACAQEDIELDGKACPCPSAAGYECDAVCNVCVPTGSPPGQACGASGGAGNGGVGGGAGGSGATTSGGGGVAGAGGSAGSGGGGGVSGTSGSDAGTDSATPTYAQEVLADAPSAYWRLGEASGATVGTDEKGVHDGQYLTVAAPVYLGRPGALQNDANTAAGFDGEHRLSVANSNPLDFGGNAPFTIELWAKWEDLDKSGATTVVKRHALVANSDTNATAGYQLYYYSDTWMLGFQRYAGPNAADRDSVETSIASESQDGKFHHIVAIYDDTAKQLRLWVDGALRGTGVADEVQLASTSPLVIGNNANGKQWFEGDLDEVAIYPFALSSDRIQAHLAAAN